MGFFDLEVEDTATIPIKMPMNNDTHIKVIKKDNGKNTEGKNRCNSIIHYFECISEPEDPLDPFGVSIGVGRGVLERCSAPSSLTTLVLYC